LPDAFMRRSKKQFCNLLAKSFFSFLTEFKLDSERLSTLHNEMDEDLRELAKPVKAH
jgi:hypothetical protein